MAEPEPINSVGNIKEAGFEDKLRIKMACRPKSMIERLQVIFDHSYNNACLI